MSAVDESNGDHMFVTNASASAICGATGDPLPDENGPVCRKCVGVLRVIVLDVMDGTRTTPAIERNTAHAVAMERERVAAWIAATFHAEQTTVDVHPWRGTTHTVTPSSEPFERIATSIRSGDHWKDGA